MSKQEVKVVVITISVFAIFLALATLMALGASSEDFVCLNQDLEICRDSWH